MRQALLVAFATLLLLVTATLLVASYFGTKTLARRQADSLMSAVRRETEVRLHRTFDPIRRKVLEDYSSIRLGRYSALDPIALKDRLYPNLFALPHVDSLMIGDLTGSQFLVMRYTPAVYASPLLAPVAATLPPPPEQAALQFFTRDFRPAERGNSSNWILWDKTGRTEVRSWELPLPGYDGRLRPWHQAAMAKFADLPLDDAHLAGVNLVAWTDVYKLFTTRKPGISASIAARDPEGRVLIIAYDLLLDEIAQFSTSARPTAHGQLVVLTEDFRLLGPPQDLRPDAAERAAAAIIQPVAGTDYPVVVRAFEAWRSRHAATTDQFRLHFAGGTWHAGFTPFAIGSGQKLWIGVILPEAELVPAALAHQKMILLVSAFALVLAVIAASWMARRFATPLGALAEQARRIAELDLAPAPPIASPVAELAALSETLGETRHSLQKGIAEREQALAALAQGEQQLRTLAENTPEIIVRVGRDTRHLFVNPAYTRATGFTPPQVLGRTLFEVPYPPEYIPVWARAIDEAVATRQTVMLEFTYPTPAGPRAFEARIIPESTAETAGGTILGVFHDITERVRSANALLQSETRYRTLIDSALVGIVVRQEGLIRFSNPAALALLGYSRLAELDGHAHFVDHVAPAYRAEIAARSASALQGANPPLHPGWQLVRRDGSHRWVQSSVCAIEWDGRPALLTFMRDITELREATERQATLEDQLRHAQKLEAVGLLAGGIAHDFNNLLQIIGGNAQLAEAEDVTSAERRESMQAIAKTVERAARITRQLLAFSRRQALAREDTDLNAFVAEHVQMLRRVLPENIRVDFTPAPAAVVVLADRGQLEQVLLNLCLNARDAMPKGGVISLRLEVVAAEATPVDGAARTPGETLAKLTVADSGHGMDQATIARIFDPFFTTKARDKGTGLGLPVVHGIVHQHGGRIEVESRPGAGSSFVIHLPMQVGAVPPPPPREPSSPHVPRRGGTILIAEDQEPIRRVATVALTRAGYAVEAVADGVEAVERFTRAPASVDLLFFDVMMPRLGGFEAAGRCRALRPQIPVVFASGYAADSVEETENVPAGAQMLQKPYRAENLIELIDRLLSSARN